MSIKRKEDEMIEMIELWIVNSPSWILDVAMWVGLVVSVAAIVAWVCKPEKTNSDYIVFFWFRF